MAAALADAALPPDRLELEVTEGLLVHDNGDAVAMLAEIKALGVRITMDDFGTGYSSLAYLQRFPFDKIKIDRSFIRQLGGRPNTRGDRARDGAARPQPRRADLRRGRGDRGPAGAAARRGLPGGARLPVRATGAGRRRDHDGGRMAGARRVRPRRLRAVGARRRRPSESAA